MQAAGRAKVESWRNLEVWQVAHCLILKTYQETKNFPSDERFRLTDQLCRAAASIPTNIAEGKGRNSTKEFLHFLFIARGSVEEVSYLLLLSQDLGYISSQTYNEMNSDCQRIGRMINGLTRSLKQHL